MINHFNFKKTRKYIERNRFTLLLISTLLVLVLPAFSGDGLLSDILFMTSINFLFIQSMNAANVRKSVKLPMWIFVCLLIFATWLKPIGIDTPIIEAVKLFSFALFFVFVIFYLVKFISQSQYVNMNVLITSINIYLLAGIIGASLAYICFTLYPFAYNFPDHIQNPNFVIFLYYSFITLSTVGYGDITPAIPETQTLSYLISLMGQLYMAIIIAFLLGKFLMQSGQQKQERTK